MSTLYFFLIFIVVYFLMRFSTNFSWNFLLNSAWFKMFIVHLCPKNDSLLSNRIGRTILICPSLQLLSGSVTEWSATWVTFFGRMNGKNFFLKNAIHNIWQFEVWVYTSFHAYHISMNWLRIFQRTSWYQTVFLDLLSFWASGS